MKILQKKQDKYYIKPIDAVITSHIMIPGISGKKINLEKSYQNMKRLNEFKESLLVYDKIKPNKSINNVYNKIIISGNQKLNNIVLLTHLDNQYCYTTKLIVDNYCMDKQTIYIEKITNEYLIKVKEKVHNGIIFYLEDINQNELNLIYKYLKNNNYNVISIDEIINE